MEFISPKFRNIKQIRDYRRGTIAQRTVSRERVPFCVVLVFSVASIRLQNNTTFIPYTNEFLSRCHA
jgi:hypothetical protein